MTTYIELFDKDAMKNLYACFVSAPDRVIFVAAAKNPAAKRAQIESHIARYGEIFADRGKAIRFEVIVWREDDLNGLADRLAEVIRESTDRGEEVSADLTGGGDLCLVAIGMAGERCRAAGVDLQMHRFDLRNSRINDCDADGRVLASVAAPDIRLRELVRAYAGKIVTANDRDTRFTVAWPNSVHFTREVEAMWSVLKSVGSLEWNNQIAVFENMSRTPGFVSGLQLSAPVRRLREQRIVPDDAPLLHGQICRALTQHGLLLGAAEEHGTLTVRFSNAAVMKCLTKAGQALEMVVYQYARNAKTKKGEVYHDVLTGAYIDWDGNVHEPDDSVVTDVENEIDVLAIHGLTPVFISCKNGRIETEELYKLQTVARRFGGGSAKMALVATRLEEMDALIELDGKKTVVNHIRERARQMGIQVIEPLARGFGDAAFAQAIADLWK